MTIGQYVKKHGLTEASNRLGIGRMTLWRWINEDRPISAIHRRYLSLKGIVLPARYRKAHKKASPR